MCRAVFAWDGLDDAGVKLPRTHGRMDHVISLREDVSHVLDGAN